MKDYEIQWGWANLSPWILENDCDISMWMTSTLWHRPVKRCRQLRTSEPNAMNWIWQCLTFTMNFRLTHFRTVAFCKRSIYLKRLWALSSHFFIQLDASFNEIFFTKLRLPNTTTPYTWCDQETRLCWQTDAKHLLENWRCQFTTYRFTVRPAKKSHQGLGFDFSKLSLQDLLCVAP